MKFKQLADEGRVDVFYFLVQLDKNSYTNPKPELYLLLNYNNTCLNNRVTFYIIIKHWKTGILTYFLKIFNLLFNKLYFETSYLKTHLYISSTHCIISSFYKVMTTSIY